MTYYVIIDLGSNSVRLTINEVMSDGSFRVVDKQKQMVRLSENMGPEKVLQNEAMDRTIEALKIFKTIYDRFENKTVRAVATAATRQAKNQKKFLKRVKDEVGLNLEVIQGNEEAYLDYLGVINTLPITNCLIMDTGGGSTELILVQNRKLQNLISLPYGAVNLSETFLEKDSIQASSFFKLMVFIDKLYNGVWWLRRGQNLPIVALGGSNRTLAKIWRREKQMQDYENIHGYRMQIQDVFNLYSRILEKNLQERKDLEGLSKERSDIIVGGLAPLVALMQFLDSDRLIFSQNGLREGALFEHLNHEKEKEQAN